MILAEQIKRATNIREVVAQYVEIRKRGREWVGLCPFHQDSSPSLSVNEEKQVFLCRACGVGGDAFTFVERIEGVSFPAAVQKLAGAAGLADAMAPHVKPAPEFELAGAELRAFDHWLYLKRNRLLARREAIEQREQAAKVFADAIWNEDEIPAEQAATIQDTLTFAHVATAAIDELIRRIEDTPQEFTQEFLRDFYSRQELREVLA